MFPFHKRTVLHRTTDADGAIALHLYWGESEISFDEPALFPFAEALAAHGRFTAGETVNWAPGLRWERARGLLGQLLEAGILRRAEDTDGSAGVPRDGARPSPLPPAPSDRPRTWDECPALMQELAGRPLELGYLELVVPVFRVAHMALDAEGRQVGEANVFPKAARIEVPTRWRTCIYAGSRHQMDRPMNVTALKSMRAHWPQMMEALRAVREAYLRRFPSARAGWTVGHLERLSTAVLAVPTYALMRRDARVANGALHPALACLFRVTDGLRMVMHQMLFVPVGEPTLAPEAPMDGATILAYAERNYSFHSEHGVCAGPQSMIEEFLATLVDGRPAAPDTAAHLDPDVQAALDAVEAALDYALHGLQAYAAVFCLWPAMTRAYERLWAISGEWAAGGNPAAAAFRDRLRGPIDRMHDSTFLATERWRAERDHVYADMYEQCARGLGVPLRSGDFAALVSPRGGANAASVQLALHRRVLDVFACAGPEDAWWAEQWTRCVQDYLLREQAILRTATDVQARINALLGRTPPTRPFDAADIDIHNLLQGTEERRVPYLIDFLEDALGIRVHMDRNRILLATPDGGAIAPLRPRPEFGRHGAGRTACPAHASPRRDA